MNCIMFFWGLHLCLFKELLLFIELFLNVEIHRLIVDEH